MGVNDTTNRRTFFIDLSMDGEFVRYLVRVS